MFFDLPLDVGLIKKFTYNQFYQKKTLGRSVVSLESKFTSVKHDYVEKRTCFLLPI